jgi:putative flippase GtrA
LCSLVTRNYVSSNEFVWRQAQMNQKRMRRVVMGFGKGALLWLLGIPLPIIILLAIFMHH